MAAENLHPVNNLLKRIILRFLETSEGEGPWIFSGALTFLSLGPPLRRPCLHLLSLFFLLICLNLNIMGFLLLRQCPVNLVYFVADKIQPIMRICIELSQGLATLNT